MRRVMQYAMVLLMGAVMMGAQTQGAKHMQAKGTFTVKVAPADGSELEKGAGVARYTLDKVWSGDMVGTSQGSMLSSFTTETGAMAYVAMEHVEATLNGRKGSFYFAHTATMNKADPASGVMKVVVVKDSGTGELKGLSGELTIVMDAKGGHSYVFDYTLP